MMFQAKIPLARKAAAMLLLATLTAGTATTAASTAPAPPQSNPFGILYSYWGATWWQWVFSLHGKQPLNPLLTEGPVDCSYGQSSHLLSNNVWFLAGSLSSGTNKRSCKVPFGTWLFFPVWNSWVDNVAVSNPSTIDQLRKAAANFADASELHANIDGAAVHNLYAYRAAYAPFFYIVPKEDNLLGVLGATVPGADWPTTFIFPAASDGYWPMLAPLSPGIHTINFGGTAAGNSPSSIDTTYQITVAPRGVF